MNKDKFSWRARGRSFRYAWSGIVALVRGEHNAWIHLCVALSVVIAGICLHLAVWEWVSIVICIGGVLMAEGFNSAIEALADKICTDTDPLIKRAKDIAAGAVLLFVVAAVIVGLLIFLPKLLTLL